MSEASTLPEKVVLYLVARLSDRVLFVVYRLIRKQKRIYLMTRSTKLVGGGS